MQRVLEQVTPILCTVPGGGSYLNWAESAEVCPFEQGSGKSTPEMLAGSKTLQKYITVFIAPSSILVRQLFAFLLDTEPRCSSEVFCC